jgi:hypothetical protein
MRGAARASHQTDQAKARAAEIRSAPAKPLTQSITGKMTV